MNLPRSLVSSARTLFCFLEFIALASTARAAEAPLWQALGTWQVRIDPTINDSCPYVIREEDLDQPAVRRAIENGRAVSFDPRQQTLSFQ
jgi:hypothetical protein